MSGLRKVRLHNYLAYGLTDMLGSGATMVRSGWLLFFYTTFCGLSPVQATSIFSLALVVDAFGSTLIGHLSDAIGETWIGRRFGRRRILLLAAIPLLPTFALIWVSGHTYVYYLTTYIVFEVFFTMVLIPYETLAAEMADDYKVRARFAGVRILTGQVAAVIASYLPRLIIGDKAGAGATTFLWLGIIFSAIFVVSVSLTWLFSWERDAANRPKAAPVQTGFNPFTLFVTVLQTLSLRAFRLHLGMYLGGYAAIDVMTAVFTYFVVFTLGGSVGQSATLLGLMSVAQFVSVGAFIWLAVRFNPAPAYRWASAVYAVSLVLLFLLTVPAAAALLARSDLTPGLAAYPIAVLAGLGRGGLIYIPWNTYNYIADVDEAVSARRREGVYAGVMTMFRKGVQAGAVMVTGIVLQWGGFVSGATVEPQSAKTAILLVLVLGPLLLLALGVLVSRHFHLGRHTHAVLMREIGRFRSGDLRAPAGEAARILKDLTGKPVHKLWGGKLLS